MRLLLSMLVLVLASARPVVLLSADSAATLFQRGVERFRAGEFAQALADFEQAERLGLSSAQLAYNYGSVLYRLGEYARSRSYFELLTGHPQLGDLARYNLALIAHRLDDERRARELFGQLAGGAADPALRQLAQRQLSKLAATTESPAPPGIELIGLLGIDLGWDSNIELETSSGGSEESGGYLQALGYVETTLGGWNAMDWTASGTLFANHFPEDEDYGYRSLALGLAGRRDLGRWQTTLSLQPERSWLGGDAFLASLELGLEFSRPLGAGRRFGVELHETRIDARSGEYDYLVGNQARLGVQWRQGGEPRRHRLRLRFEDNDRRNDIDSDSSPRRYTLDWRIEQDLAGGRLLIGRIEFRRSRYHEVAELSRSDDRWRLEIGGRQRLDAGWRVEETLQLTANDSELESEDYRKTLLFVSFQRFF